MEGRILFVDDEPNILQGFQRNLRKDFDVSVSLSGLAALELIKESEQFAVIISDMQMPEMDGVEFLAQAKKSSPDSVRIMLTGNADQQTAVDALHKGDIFRFINKPCAHENVSRILKVAVNQYHLSKAEKDILDNTLKGCINALTEVLSLTKPETFGTIARLKEYSAITLAKLGAATDWELESLAQLSQVGYLVLPDSIIEKLNCGVTLDGRAQELFEKHPEAAYDLLKRIPRLENLAEALRYQLKGFDGSGLPDDDKKGTALPFGARLLKVITDFNQAKLISNAAAAAATLKQQSYLYDPQILDALLESVDNNNLQKVREVNIRELRTGMVIASDICTEQGALLISQGQEITNSVIDRLINFSSNGTISAQISVYF